MARPGPLAGTSVFSLVSGADGAAVLEAVQEGGGCCSASIRGATHLVVPPGWCLISDLPGLEVRAMLETCIVEDVPVVEASWLESVLTLDAGRTWHQVLLAPHAPLVVEELKSASRQPVSYPVAMPPEVLAPPAEIESPATLTSRVPLTGSLNETWEFLRREHPDEIEAGQMRIAVERSLLDFAVILRTAREGPDKSEAQSPEDVLGVPKGASAAEIRAAYREKALTAHPDKGGDPGAFCRLQKAYRSLTGGAPTEHEASGSPHLALPAARVSETKDFELREHRNLVESWFQHHGEDLRQHVVRQERVLEALGLEVCDVGTRNRNERGEEMRNQCFYLSLSRCYLGGDQSRSTLEYTALQLKRVVEAAVLAAHPDWGGSRVGEDVQAFSDFLFFVLGTHSLLSEVCVAVFDSVSGGVEVYRGKHYPESDREDDQRANLLCIRYVPGHYQAMVPSIGTGGPTLPELLGCFEEFGVLYVVTDG